MNTTKLTSDEDFTSKVEVYAGGGPVSRAIQMSAALFGDLFNGMKILVVDEGNSASEEILHILEKNPKTKVIVINFERYYSKDDSAFPKIIKYPNTRVISSIQNILVDLAKYAEELKDVDENEEMSFRIDEVQQKVSSNIIGILQHDLKPYVLEEKGQRYNEILEKARSSFGINPRTSDESVVEFILNTPREIVKVFEGILSGVYCDIDDTILRPDGTIMIETLEKLEKLEKEGKEIHIWTGGDLEKAKEKLSKTPFARFPIVSKHDYAGAEAEIVIDNVSPEKFALQTGITAKRFIRID